MVKTMPISVERLVVNRVGRMISAGARLPIDARTATMDAGKSCNEVALSTKNMAEENSAFSV